MANVLHPTFDFHPRPVPHAPPSFGFGFGLRPAPSSSAAASSSMNPSWGTPSPTPGHTNPAAFHQLASSVAQAAARPGKRNRDSDDDPRHTQHATGSSHHNHNQPGTPGSAQGASRDDAMDRSPTPERPKRGAPKRARVVNSQDSSAGAKDGSSSKADKDAAGGEDDVDIGVLLASLPPQSLLPILTALIESQPSLKTMVLPLIPRPTLETALQALAQAAKSLRDAYPYSQTPTYTPVSVFSSPARPPTSSIFDNQSTMRDDYVISRLRPFIHDFVSAFMTYLPYFSCTTQDQQQQPNPSSSPSDSSTPTPASNRATTLHSLHKDKFHPSESFAFLHAVSNHIAGQPPLTLNALGPLVVPRLAQEWRMWVERIDAHVNRHAGMFGSEMVRGWERALDELAGSKALQIAEVMKEVRNVWVQRVGWLSGGSRSFQMMDEQ